ncbi:DnaJ C-terminal domain-containing protein [Rhodovibrionaceae bacterium A322]
MADLYKTLDVSRTADEAEIKQAYRKLAKKLHPDLNPGDEAVEQRFKEVSQAYAILSDKEKRRQYDAGEIDATGQDTPRRGGFYRSHAGGGRNDRYSHYEFGDENVEDIFSDLFGGFGSRQGSRRTPHQKGVDVSYSVDVEFLEAANGAKKRIQLSDGKTLNVNIPAGTEEGQTLRLKGQGMPGIGGAGPGDAFFEVHIRPHAYFERKNFDVHMELPISLQEAILGANVQVPTINSKVTLKIPAGANSGTTLRLKGKGILDRKNGQQGDQYIKLKVVLPDSIDEDLKSFLEAWAPDHTYDPRKKAGMTD